MRDTQSSLRGPLRAVRQADASASARRASQTRGRCAPWTSCLPALPEDVAGDEPLLRILRFAHHAVRARSPARRCADAGDAAGQASGAASAETSGAARTTSRTATSGGCGTTRRASARSSGTGANRSAARSCARAACGAASTATAPGTRCPTGACAQGCAASG